MRKVRLVENPVFCNGRSRTETDQRQGKQSLPEKSVHFSHFVRSHRDTCKVHQDNGVVGIRFPVPSTGK